MGRLGGWGLGGELGLGGGWFVKLMLVIYPGLVFFEIGIGWV